MAPPVRVIGIGHMGYWLVACTDFTTLACSAIISLTEGTIRQCSLWWSVDWQLKQG